MNQRAAIEAVEAMGAVALCLACVVGLGLAISRFLRAQQYFTGAGQTASGSLTAADATAGASGCSSTKCVQLTLGSNNGNVGTAAVSLQGTFVGTAVVEGSVDGTNYSILAILSSTTATQTWVTSATAPGIWVVNVAGFSNIQIRCSAYTSGTITAFLRSAAASTP